MFNINAHVIVRDARRSGHKLHRQHALILAELAASDGTVGYTRLAIVIGSWAANRRNLLSTRIIQLRKALRPLGFAIKNHRKIGYELILSS